MIARRLSVAGAIAVATLAIVPAVAQAAPVNTARAILAAHEFPPGSSGYKVETETLDPFDEPEGSSTPCSRFIRTMFERLGGAQVTSAQASRGATDVEVAVVNRPMAALMAEGFPTCEAQVDPRARSTVLAAPADLTRLRPFVFKDADEMQAWVDLRGISVNVTATTNNRGPADADAFWQVLRTQIAKVERQP
ncbi:hypothetical protein FK268_07800 [Tsukamurella sputi]|uniref:DUF3558 domain-containing protein n=1 Tax=Tsukamurella sputi TaxID=2591848 RepID=A0A5C5RRN8_9ACTN|nr:hypothetical protein [Tsukamurella sputi]TWS25113.1 hypothetical protein FK268_07800 [Tsukamurella sputi]